MSGLFDLTGKVAVITGSTRGIGRAIAGAMAKAGARVVISGRKADQCDEVVSNLLNDGFDALPVACNVGRKEDLERLASETRRHFGRIDCLVLNAAINPYYGPLLQMPEEVFGKMVDSNLRSKLLLCSIVLPQMAQAGGGSAIVMSSIAGLAGSQRLGMYAITKSADMQLVRNLAVEWGPEEIRVNGIAPGIVRTDFSRALWEDPAIAAQAANYPLRRFGEPGDVAGAAVFLASQAASWMNGQTIV
ncbi:MAG TPA: SDR family oxidoreductase, partial [Acidobacteriota bacterium]|nr:SDR family oxidoreductase [Acidobacteriota bacterium]